MRGFEAAQRAYDNMTPPDEPSIPDAFVFIECPECGHKHKGPDASECYNCEADLSDVETQIDEEGYEDYCLECKAEYQAEARRDAEEEW